MKDVGSWIIWDGDTYPHPRKIISKRKVGKGFKYMVNGKRQGVGEYIKDDIDCKQEQIDAARLCRWEEIPEQFREPIYEIY